MDAISFVLGIKSSHLRSAHLKDLIYRGRVLKTSKINDDGVLEEWDGKFSCEDPCGQYVDKLILSTRLFIRDAFSTN